LCLGNACFSSFVSNIRYKDDDGGGGGGGDGDGDDDDDDDDVVFLVFLFASTVAGPVSQLAAWGTHMPQDSHV
jgi:hypothetical protein